MVTLREAARQALEALGHASWGEEWQAIAASETARTLRQALAAERQAEPNGVVLVPKRMTTAMRRVTDQEGWTWEDLLAAAEAITEDEHTDLGRSQQQAKPVHQMQRADGSWVDQDKQAFAYNASHGWPTRVLYTHPQPAQWVGLTDDDIDPDHPFIDSIRAIEAKLREKNGGAA